MVLTGIVVSVSATALALAIVRRIHASTGRTHLSATAPE
jgi:multicomponent Na+:H+ antiporter subunit C